MNEQELAAWASSAEYWTNESVPCYGLDRKNVRKQSGRVLALIAEVRKLTTDARRYRRERDLIQVECDRLRLLNEMIGKDEMCTRMGMDDAKAEITELEAEVRRVRKYKGAYEQAMDVKNTYACKMTKLREVLDVQ